MNKLLRTLIFVFAASCSCPEMLSASEKINPGPQLETRVLSIQEVVQMALGHSPEAMLAKAQIMRAGEAVRETRSLNRPQLYTGTGLAYNNGFPLSIEGSAPSIFQVAATQSIFSKKNANLIHEAEESMKASRFGSDSVRNDLALKTALAYYRLHRARRIITLTSERLDAAHKQQELVEAQYEAGRVRPVDLTLAQTSTMAAEQQLLVAQEQAKLGERELRAITGLPNTVSIKTLEPRIDSTIFEMDGDSLYRQAIERTPEILRAEATLKAKEYHVEAEKGESWPRLELVSEYALFSRTNNYEDYFNRFTRNNYLLGLSVQVPLFTGSRTSSRVEQSRQDVSIEHYKLQSMKSDLKLNIQRSLSTLRIAHSSLKLARSEEEAAREILQINETLLQNGRISVKEFEDSRLQLQQKEVATLEADEILFQRKLELLHTVGIIASEIQ
jgi:outer membrane protein